MKRNILFFLFALAIAAATFFPSCKHDPLAFIEDPTDIIDTTGGGGGDTTLLTSNCDPDTVYFENDVFPILISNCAISGCHDAETHEEGINLSTYNKVISSGIFDVDDPYGSEFFENVTRNDDDIMPPAPMNPLTDEEIALIVLWQEQGALNNACTDCDTANVTFTTSILPIMEAYCTGCHDATSPSGGISLTAYLGSGSNDGIVDVASDGRLLGSLQQEVGFISMPPGGTVLPDCLIEKIRIWVDAGYPED